MIPSISLENDRVLLKPLEWEDSGALAQIAFSPEIWQWTPSRIRDEAELHTYLEKALAGRDTGQRFPFLIIDKKTGNIAGSSSYGNLSPPDRRIEIGWTWLGLGFQRTGVNRACKALMLDHAFSNLEMERVEFKTDVLNRQSRAALLDIGAVEEGILRSHTLMHDGRRRDTIFYSILKIEWPAIRRTVFQSFF